MRAGFLCPKYDNFLVYILAKIKMSFIWKDNFFAKIHIFCKWICSNISKRCSSVCTTIFIRRKNKTNYLSHQTWAKYYHSRNKHYLKKKKKTLDSRPYRRIKICLLSTAKKSSCHTAEATLDVLRPVLKIADVVLPSRNCDFTPLDYYLWGAFKAKCYADKPETIEALKDNICEAIGEIQLRTIDNVLKNCTDSAWPAQADVWMKLFSIINRSD